MERCAWRCCALAQARTSRKRKCCLKPWVMHECVADIDLGCAGLALCAPNAPPGIYRRYLPEASYLSSWTVHAHGRTLSQAAGGAQLLADGPA